MTTTTAQTHAPRVTPRLVELLEETETKLSPIAHRLHVAGEHDAADALDALVEAAGELLEAHDAIVHAGEPGCRRCRPEGFTGCEDCMDGLEGGGPYA